MVSLLRGGFSMRCHLTIMRAAFVALFFIFSSPSLALNFIGVEQAYAACQAAILSGQVCLPVENVQGCSANTGQYTNYQSFLRTTGTTTCSGAAFYNYTNGCPVGHQFNTSSGLCESLPSCPAGQYKQLGGSDVCEVPSCPSGYYVNLTVADGFYDCTVLNRPEFFGGRWL